MKKLLLTLFAVFTLFNLRAQNPEIQNLFKKLNQGEIDQAINEGLLLLEKDSNNIDLNHIIGRAYFYKGEFDIAIGYLEKSILTDSPKSSTKAWGYNFLGKCYLMKDNLEKAKEYFYKSYNMKATKNVTKSSYFALAGNGLLNFYDNWKKVESEHFIFYFQDSGIAEYFVKSREKAYDSISNYLNVKLEKKIRYFVWSSRKDAKEVLKRHLGFSRPELYLIHSAYNQTPGHEMTHVISNYTKEIKVKAGLINEGLAVYLDLDDKDDRGLVLSAMKKYNIKKIDIKSFWLEWNKYSDEISYPLAGLFVGDLIKKYGKEKFLVFFADQSYKNAKAVFGDNFDDFIKEFEAKFN